MRFEFFYKKTIRVAFHWSFNEVSCNDRTKTFLTGGSFEKSETNKSRSKRRRIIGSHGKQSVSISRQVSCITVCVRQIASPWAGRKSCTLSFSKSMNTFLQYEMTKVLRFILFCAFEFFFYSVFQNETIFVTLSFGIYKWQAKQIYLIARWKYALTVLRTCSRRFHAFLLMYQTLKNNTKWRSNLPHFLMAKRPGVAVQIFDSKINHVFSLSILNIFWNQQIKCVLRIDVGSALLMYTKCFCKIWFWSRFCGKWDHSSCFNELLQFTYKTKLSFGVIIGVNRNHYLLIFICITKNPLQIFSNVFVRPFFFIHNFS